MKTQSVLVLAITVFLFGFGPIGFGTTASFQGLGRPGTGPNDWSTAYGVSADGSVVVGRANYKPFRWTAEGGLVLLESLLEGYNSGAHAVSGDGQTVVGSSVVVNGCEAFRWTAESGTVGLGYLSGSYLDSRAFGVSSDGSVVVGWGKGASGYYKAFRWTTSGGMQERPTGGLVSYAEGVSGNGAVIVGRSDSEAFRLVESGGIVGLGDLPGGAFWSGAKAVSLNGLVVVGYSSSASSGGGNEAFRWTAEDSMVGLGDLPGGDFYSVAEAVSGDGSVVVGRSVVDGNVSPVGTWTEEAFMWDPDNAMRNIKDVLENDFGLDLTGWMLHRATGISDDGSTIVGCGTNPNGYGEGWIATIPEPVTTYYVDALNGDDDNDGLSPETAFATIQKGIDSADVCDTVIVAPDTYTGPGNRDLDFLGKPITVRSIDPNDHNIVATTIIDCQGSGRGFYFHNGENNNSVLDGFTITNGYHNYGGGIYCNGSDPTVTNCTFSSNYAYNRGGGMYNYNNSSPTIANCIFRENTAGDLGGGMYNENSSPTVTYCIFRANTAYAWGGGMLNYNSSPTVTGCFFEKNEALFGGGMDNIYSSPTVVNCVFSENYSGEAGGAMYNDGKPAAKLVNCIFSGNYADNAGGAMSNYGSSPTLVNCTFSRNSATNKGGAIVNDYSRYPSPKLTSCIIWGNEAPTDPEISNYNSNPTITYCDVQGGYEGEGNIDANPCFVEPGFWDPNGTPDEPWDDFWVEGDYHLLQDSPCIDAGDNTAVPADTTDLDGDGNTTEPIPWDLDGQPRIISGRIDIGADEYAPPIHNITQDTYHETIQDAIDHANNSDEIVVSVGTYTGPGNRDIDFLGKAIIVRSENGPENCIIDCNGTEEEFHGGFYFYSGEDANSVVAGFTIINGYNWWQEEGGGGISCWDSNPTITNCTITGNTVDEGGGIFCEYSSPTITNCTITGNSATYGGGIYCWRSSPIINNCTISNNSAEHGGGGGISCEQSSPTITNCTFTGNSADGEWAAAGGIYCSYSSPTITNCTITGNSADGEWACGGGISCWGGNPTITNCTFNGNSAEYGGGGIFCGGTPIITNCTITGNSAGYNGGGIFCYDSSPTITNCILWSNQAPDGSEIYLDYYSNAWVTYTDVQGGQDDVYIDTDSELNWGNGNIDADPCFVEPGYWDANGTPSDANDDFWVDGDYHLKGEGWRWDNVRQRWDYDEVTSRCIDAGNPGSPLGDEPMSVPDDPNNIWGENIRINMGAYGGTAEGSMPPYDWAILADLTNDGKVDSNDLAAFVDYWLYNEECVPSDLNRDQYVDMFDFALFGQDWCLETIWHE